MKIYLTRHSQTLWNKEKKLQGHKDSPLTLEGIENAYALKTYLENKSFNKVYASPILRAYHTAQIIRPDDSIIKEPLIMEMNFGDYEGRYIDDLLKYEDYYNLWNHPELFSCLPNGESYQDVFYRAHCFIDHLLKSDDEDILVVTHGMFFIVLLASLLGYNQEDLTLFNQKVVEGCSLTCLEYKDNCFKLLYYNDCSYLPHTTDIAYTK